MQNYKNLEVWKKGHKLTLELYRETKGFPNEELYGLTSQIRRSGSSIPANIAEGSGRDSDSDFARFLQIAQGSANEVEYHLLLAKDLNYLSKPKYQKLQEKILEIKKMLSGLIKKVRSE